MVPATLISLALGLGLGRLTGGRIGALANLRVAAPLAAFGALAVAVLASVVTTSRPVSVTLLIGSYGLAAIFLAANRKHLRGTARAGMGMLALGWLLNATVIALNGGMPLSLHAYEISGQHATVNAGEGGFVRIVIADDSTSLPWLGDVVPLPPLRQVLSPGDLLLLAGMTIFVAGSMHLPAGSSAADFPHPHRAR